MSKKEKMRLSPTKAETAEKRLEELINHNSILKCVFLAGTKFYANVDDSEFRKYPDGFEVIAISTPETITTKGLLYVEKINVCFMYNLDAEHEKQDIQRGE